MPDRRIRLLLDTDIGSDIDDAVALAYLLRQPRCELVGITTVSGEPRKRAEIASAICRHAGRDDIPIHAGSERPILIEQRQPVAPQARALGDWPRRRDFADATAVPFLQRTIRSAPGELTLLAIGPLTNVAMLLAMDPQIVTMLRQLVLMCGRFFESGSAEWNARCDPHAAAIVYGAAARSAAPRHVSYGVDVTTRCRLSAEQFRTRFAAADLRPVLDLAEVWFEGRDTVTFHDPLAAACIFEPQLCRYVTGQVTVTTEGDTAGATRLDQDARHSPHTIATQVDAEAFFEHYFSIVCG